MAKKKFLNAAVCFVLLLSGAKAQICKTNADLDTVVGKYLTAAQYPWPAARAEYFNNLKNPADKAIAKRVLGQLENIEQKSHAGFKLTGGNWENYYTTKGYEYTGNYKLGTYTFESALHEFFCLNGKLKRNDEYSTVLRIYVNALPLNTLNTFLRTPFGSSMGEYDLGIQYLDWKNHKASDVNAQMISLFGYLSCARRDLIDSINYGNGYFQDVEEKDIKPNSRNPFIYRYWFIRKNQTPLLVPVSRKAYLESLLEYYEREKIYFSKLMEKFREEHSNSIKPYSNWETDVADKIAAVQKALNENSKDWLAAPAVINKIEDASLNYKAGKKEKTNYNRFWKFYDGEKKSEFIYAYNPGYFRSAPGGDATPQFITISFRYVSIPSSLRLLNNFTSNFYFKAVKNLLE